MRVLLVDDEAELVSTMAERLTMRGIEAFFATTGKEAAAFLAENEVDVVVLDVKMPGTSGVALMRRLEETRPGLKYIFLTGHGSEEDYRECTAAGAYHYLMKPASLDMIVATIRETVGETETE